MVALKLISTLFACAAMATFIYWMLGHARKAYAQGVSVLAEFGLQPGTQIEQSTLLTRMGRLAGPFVPAIARLEAANRLGVPGYLAETERLLLRAGVRMKMTPLQFVGGSVGLALVGGALFVGLGLLYGMGPIAALIIGFPSGATVGFFLPYNALKTMAYERVALIEKRLPFAIEFMLLAMEANASLQVAMQVYSDEMTNDPLSEEIRVVLTDVKSGLDLQQALLNLRSRVELEPLAALILALIMAGETGQSPKEVLQTQSTVARLHRYQSAEEVAKTASTRAVFPLFLVVIAVLLLLLGPMFIKFARESIF